MSRLLAFRSAALAVLVLLASGPAGAEGFATPPSPTPFAARGEATQDLVLAPVLARTDSPAGCETLDLAPQRPAATASITGLEAMGPETAVEILLGRSRTPAASREGSPQSKILAAKPMHLADFLLQTHSAFHLAAALPAGEPARVSVETTSLVRSG